MGVYSKERKFIMFNPQRFALDVPPRKPRSSSVQISAAAVIVRLESTSVCAVMDFLRDERAATAIEYGLIVTGIAIGTLAVLAVVGAKIKAAFLLLTTGV
jgi:Flp pilus assembly pilin Flp